MSAKPEQMAVAYLDLGVGGYIDIGTDLSDEALAALPKGRHMLGIIGTYGVEGYTPAQPAPSVPIDSIGKLLTQAMDVAVANGANSASMPDELVEVAAWLSGVQPAPSVPDVWLPVPKKHPTFDPVDLQLSDGSVLCGCLPQANGDYWWEGPSGEVFIDPKYANVTHWRLAAAPKQEK